MKFEKYFPPAKQGFTLVELLIVIAIIGILASVVTVSMQGSVEKSKTASAVTTMSSILPEIVTCQDDNGRISAYSPGGVICIEAASTSALSGHTVTWPNVTPKTGYTIINAAIIPNASIGSFIFTATKSTQPTITCSYANNECTVAAS